MSFNGEKKVIHLEVDDFKKNVLTYKNHPVKGIWIVMVQGSYCGYCTQMKPLFAKMSRDNKYNDVTFATIQIDGTEQEQNLNRLLPKIINTDINGVPAFLRFENGKFSAMIMGGQNERQLVEFMK
jgi:thiol-disulfide isomerase/thioredoxin